VIDIRSPWPPRPPCRGRRGDDRIEIDTTVLIDALRGDPSAFAWLAELAEQPSCSEVTRVEILRGLRSQERAVAERLFAGRARPY